MTRIGTSRPSTLCVAGMLATPLLPSPPSLPLPKRLATLAVDLLFIIFPKWLIPRRLHPASSYKDSGRLYSVALFLFTETLEVLAIKTWTVGKIRSRGYRH